MKYTKTILRDDSERTARFRQPTGADIAKVMIIREKKNMKQ